jgi:hypothetical protein
LPFSNRKSFKVFHKVDEVRLVSRTTVLTKGTTRQKHCFCYGNHSDARDCSITWMIDSIAGLKMKSCRISRSSARRMLNLLIGPDSELVGTTELALLFLAALVLVQASPPNGRRSLFRGPICPDLSFSIRHLVTDFHDILSASENVQRWHWRRNQSASRRTESMSSWVTVGGHLRCDVFINSPDLTKIRAHCVFPWRIGAATKRSDL